MTKQRAWTRLARCLPFAVGVATLPGPALAQAWDAVKYFQYNIENVTVTPTAVSSTGVPITWSVKTIFSVTNPATGDTWDIKSALPFQSPGASMSLNVIWDPSTDITGTGSANATLSPVFTTGLGTGAAMPVRATGLLSTALSSPANRCNNTTECPGVASLVNRFWVARSVTPVAFMSPVTTGRVAIEGRAVCNGVTGYSCPPAAAPPAAPYLNIPVRSEVASFRFTATESLAAIIADPRRPIVDIAKCKGCHDGNTHGDTVVPRLSLHGNNRNENLGLCVICHNPNQTDVPYRYLTAGTTADPRIAGPEVPIDFKTMVHSIHAGGIRDNRLVIIGFGSSVNDFSDVRFPKELRDCTNCHIKEASGKWTFELPLKSSVLGTTVTTQSNYLVAPLTVTPTVTFAPGTRYISVNPFDDVKMTPTAAACSACHDKAEVRSHMVRTGGASFATKQEAIGKTVIERCANCHGPGKDRDVRKVHQIGTNDDAHDD